MQRHLVCTRCSAARAKLPRTLPRGRTMLVSCYLEHKKGTHDAHLQGTQDAHKRRTPDDHSPKARLRRAPSCTRTAAASRPRPGGHRSSRTHSPCAGSSCPRSSTHSSASGRRWWPPSTTPVVWPSWPRGRGSCPWRRSTTLWCHTQSGAHDVRARAGAAAPPRGAGAAATGHLQRGAARASHG